MSDSTEIVKSDRPKVTIERGQMVLTDMEQAFRIAGMLMMAGWCPGMASQTAATVAILHGATLGLSPMQAVQSIAVINGRPSLWGDALVGIVLGSGLCELIECVIEGKGDDRVAVCTAARKGWSKQIVVRFSVEDAKTAGLWGKAGPWKQYPERMLKNRARAFALRDGFADILRGVGVIEEEQDRADPHVDAARQTTARITQVEPAPLDDDDAKVLAALDAPRGKPGIGDENAKPPPESPQVNDLG